MELIISVQKILFLLLFMTIIVGEAKSQEGINRLHREDSMGISSIECEIISNSGLQYEQGVTRRDPSDIIKGGDKYYMWYTKITKNDSGYPSGYHGTIWYATSTDGKHWTEQGMALNRGQGDVWDGYGVFTPNILVANNQYYLFYTGVAPGFSNYPYNGYKKGPATSTAIGVAVASSPDGPWRRFDGNPVLKPDTLGTWDDWRVDDACLIKKDGKYWLYYKGRQKFGKKGGTPMGVAIANSPTGPYIRSDKNPLIRPGHEVLVWKHVNGVTALVAGSETVWYSSDGLQFKLQGKIECKLSAPGAYRPDAFIDTNCGKGIRWGITMESVGDSYFGFSEQKLSAFKCMLSVDKCK